MELTATRMHHSTEKYEATLQTLVPINALAPQDRKEIVRQGEARSYRKGQHVFKQGDRDSYVFYLLEGELELYADGQLVKKVVGQTDGARYALAQLQPRQLSAKACTAVTVLRLERSLLDRMLALSDNRGCDSAVEVSEEGEEEDAGDWMSRMLQSELFARIPPANIQKLFALMEAVDVSAGQTVVEQGTPGDFYFVIQRGQAEVTRTAAGQSIKLADLKDGDSFGEEALVADATTTPP